jgi:hypothetical protein
VGVNIAMTFKERFDAWKLETEKFEQSGERDRRRAICLSCECFVDSIVGQWCGKCHCNMQLKTAVMEANCPLDAPKWTAFNN